MSNVIAGSFSTGSTAAAGQASDALVIDARRTTLLLTLVGLDGSNTVKSQKRATPGGAWVDQTTYNSDQAAVSVAVAEREEWRLLTVAQQAIRTISYRLELGAQSVIASGFQPVAPVPDPGGGVANPPVAALSALVSAPGNPLQALVDNASAILALVGVSIGGSTYFVGDYAVAGYVV